MPIRQQFGNWTHFMKAVGTTPKKWIPTQHGSTRKGTRNRKRKKIDCGGYLAIFEPTHPLANQKGYVLEHRKIAYDAGVLTDIALEIHHINGDKHDNRLENLQPIDKATHASISTPLGTKRPRPASRKCLKCDKITASKYGLCAYHYRNAWANGTLEVI